MGNDLFDTVSLVVLGGAALVAFIAWAWPYGRVPDGKFGVEIVGSKRSTTVVPQGQRGVQPRLLPSGASYFRWRRHVAICDQVVIPDGCLGVVTSHVGAASQGETALYSGRFGAFTDLDVFLVAGGQQGVQEAVLPPGIYAIHPFAFEVIVVDEADASETYTVYGRQSSATDAMALAEPFVIETEYGTAFAILPDSDDSHRTLASLVADEPGLGVYRVARYIARPAEMITIEWEVALPLDGSVTERDLIAHLNGYANEEFGSGYGRWSLVDFVTRVGEIERRAQAAQERPVRITEAVMLPATIARPQS